MINSQDDSDFKRLSTPAEGPVWWLQGVPDQEWRPIAHDMEPDMGWWQAILAWMRGEAYSKGERPITVKTYNSPRRN